MLSSNQTFHMFALSLVKLSNIIIELVSYKGTRRELFFLSDFNEHTAPLFSKAKMLKFIDFIQIEDRIF